MFSSNEGYAFTNKGSRKEQNGAVSFVKHIYTFTSKKSNQTYIIEVDEFQEFLLFAIKFYLKAHRHSDFKFNHCTNLQEAPSCISTCINVMLALHDKNPYHSFAFIGAASANEPKHNTKRFRLYKKVMGAVFSPVHFKHFQHFASSTYLMLNKLNMTSDIALREKIESFFLAHYDLALED